MHSTVGVRKKKLSKHVKEKSTDIFSFGSQVEVKSFSFCSPSRCPSHWYKGSLSLKGLWFPSACSRCCILNKSQAHTTSKQVQEGKVKDRALLSSRRLRWQAANSVRALRRCHNNVPGKRGALFSLQQISRETMRDVTMAAGGDSLIFKHDAGVSSTVMNAKLMRWVFLFTHLNPRLDGN